MSANVAEVARAQRAADLLLNARARRTLLCAFPDEVRPQSLAEAYAVQDKVVKDTGPVGGWKVGAKTPVAEPTCAPLCQAWVTRSPARFPRGAFTLYGIEAELAFTLGCDLPPRSSQYSSDELAGAVASVHPVIELVDSRFADIGAVDALSLLADSLSNGALVVGDGIALPAPFDVTTQTVELEAGEADLVVARGSNPSGSPFRLLAWLANHAAERCGGLRRGEIVTTGSWTGMRFVAPGTHVASHFPGIGGVRVDL